jgi:hypothetical protein
MEETSDVEYERCGCLDGDGGCICGSLIYEVFAHKMNCPQAPLHAEHRAQIDGSEPRP